MLRTGEGCGFDISELLAGARRRLAAAGVDSAALDAQVMLAAAAEVDRTTLLGAKIQLWEAVRSAFELMVRRRLAREPLAYILGRREFYSLEFEITPDVLIPRPETETLVDVALGFIAQEQAARVLDIGTGSGAIAVAIAVNAPRASIVATDVSEAALAVARRNAVRHGVGDRIAMICADGFESTIAPHPGPPLSQGEGTHFDAIVSNPPYVAAGEIASLEPEVRDFEPRIALDGGADGLDFFRRIAGHAREHLRAGGLIALENGAGQDEEVKGILAETGFREIALRRDLGGVVRVISARR